MDGLGHVVNITGGKAAHGDATALEQVDVLLLHQVGSLLHAQPCVAEHPDLLGDMGPGSRGAQLLQSLTQARPHADNAVRHGADSIAPLLIQGRVFENSVDNAAAVGRWVGVHGPHNERHLGLKAGYDEGVPDDDSEIAGALVVEAKVLGEGLRTEELEAALDKVADRPGISVQATGCKTLQNLVFVCF